MLNSRRLLAAALVTAATTLAGLLTVTGAHGSAPTAPPAVTPPTPSKSPMPPSAPAGLTATSVTPTSVTLTWTASRPGCCGIEGYDVTWNQAFDDVYRLTRAGNVTTVTITENIRPATQYSFRVAAYDNVGHRSLSSEAVTVVTPLAGTGADTTPPQAPSGLTISGETLTWSPSTDDVAVTGYDVYWFDGWFTSRLLATVTGTSYTTVIPAGRNVYYVRARDAAGNVSIASNTVTVNPSTTTPPPPPPPVCRVSYQHTAQWDRGFVAAVKITNTGPAPVDGWTLRFTFGGDERITSAWNGVHSQEGAAVTVRNAGWNAALAPGASRDVGLIGTWTAPKVAPAGFTLNGAPCTTQ